MRKDYDDRMYEMLNEMDQQVADYDVENVTDMELQTWKKSFQKNRMKNDRRASGRKMKYVAAAFAAVCLTGVFFHNPVMAQVDILTYHMQDIMGKNSDLSSYSKAINKTLSKDGVTISLGDVILDEESMFINYSVKDENTYDSEEAKLGSGIDVMLYVNGIPSFGGMRGASNLDVDSTGTEVCLMECDYTPKNLEKEQQYKIRFSYYNENGKAKKIGDISFVADGNQLMQDTHRVEINREVTLTRGTVINLKEYVGNPVQQKIIVEYKKESKDTSVIEALELIGKDNLGREMKFYLASRDGDTGRIVLHYMYNEDTESEDTMMLFDNTMDMSEVTSFTVRAYSRMFPNKDKDGEVETTLQPIGEEFTINIK